MLDGMFDHHMLGVAITVGEAVVLPACYEIFARAKIRRDKDFGLDNEMKFFNDMMRRKWANAVVAAE